MNATHANMCTNLKHVVLVLAHFRFYPLISAISKTLKCAIYQLTLGILASSQISIKLQPRPFALKPCALVKWSEFWVVTMTQKWPLAIF